jgi:hypothetical protein
MFILRLRRSTQQTLMETVIALNLMTLFLELNAKRCIYNKNDLVCLYIALVDETGMP